MDNPRDKAPDFRPGERATDTERLSVTVDREPVPGEVREVDRQTMPLREEELIAHKTMREVGVVRAHKKVEEFPGRLEVDALREEVAVDHVPVGREVSERKRPWQGGDDVVVPVYEEQMVLVKRLVLKEELHIHRVSTTERRVVEDTLRRERPVIDSPDPSLVHERYQTGDRVRDERTGEEAEQKKEDDGLLGRLGRKLIE